VFADESGRFRGGSVGGSGGGSAVGSVGVAARDRAGEGDAPLEGRESGEVTRVAHGKAVSTDRLASVSA